MGEGRVERRGRTNDEAYGFEWFPQTQCSASRTRAHFSGCRGDTAGPLSFPPNQPYPDPFVIYTAALERTFSVNFKWIEMNRAMAMMRIDLMSELMKQDHSRVHNGTFQLCWLHRRCRWKPLHHRAHLTVG